jgi:hypothetical protein
MPPLQLVMRNCHWKCRDATVSVGRQLFPDRASYKREENRRWELVDAHWDLPIHEVDPHASDQ